MTPLVVEAGGGVLVTRGWAYSPDGRTVDLDLLAEPETATVVGVFVVPPRSARSIHPDSVETPYPLLGAVVRRTDPPDSLPAGIVLLDPPVLDAGSHRSYVFQWFSFALIAAVGGTLLTVRGAGDRRLPSAA